jgi:cysteine desulfurase/selenocysteine lyase
MKEAALMRTEAARPEIGMNAPAGPAYGQAIRKDFPILKRRVHGRRLVYLDNAATTQKPKAVLDALTRYYETTNAHIHRGLFALSEEATERYEGVRGRVAKFVGGVDPRGVVFTRNATEGLNLVASAWGRKNLKPGDEVLLTEMEHHSNLVPWIEAARETGAALKYIPILDDGTLDMAALPRLLTNRTRVVAVTLASNVLGTVNPVAEITEEAHKRGAVVVVDGVQAVPHFPVDVKALGCDFFAFSAHKMLGPTGVGVLCAKPEVLERMEPYQTGGGMIREVHLDRATWAEIPWRFEAGTPNIADVAAFEATLDYLEALGMENVLARERELTQYALERLRGLDFLKLFGPEGVENRLGVLSMHDEKIHPHDLGTVLDQYGVAIRAGHHCAQPLMRRLGVVATARASLYVYNDRDDVDMLVEALKGARKYFGHAVS